MLEILILLAIIACPEPPDEDPIELAPGRTINVIWDNGIPETQTTPPDVHGLEPEGSAGYIPYNEGLMGYRFGGLDVPPAPGSERVTYRYWANGRCERLTETFDPENGWVETERMWGAWSYS